MELFSLPPIRSPRAAVELCSRDVELHHMTGFLNNLEAGTTTAEHTTGARDDYDNDTLLATYHQATALHCKEPSDEATSL